MRFIKSVLLVSILSIVVLSIGCDKLQNIKGSVSGTVFRDGSPLMGQIQLIDPRTGGTLKLEPVNNAGHFIISDVPSGEWIMAFVGPTGMPIGNFMYVKVQTGRPVTGITFEINEVDPKAVELMERVKAEKAGTPAEGGK